MRTILRTRVALLGVRIALGKVAALGTFPILAVIVAVLSTNLFGVILAEAFRMRPVIGSFSASAVGLCGASAALAGLEWHLPQWPHAGCGPRPRASPGHDLPSNSDRSETNTSPTLL